MEADLFWKQESNESENADSSSVYPTDGVRTKPNGKCTITLSSNGRMLAFEAGDVGSIPTGVTTIIIIVL